MSSWLGLAAIGCGASQPHQDFVVVVRGSRTSLSTYSIVAATFAEGKLTYKQTYWQKSYRRATDLLGSAQHDFVVESLRDGTRLSSLRLSPFLCREMADASARQRDGWSFVEKREVLLGDDGTLSQYPTLGFLPNNSCEAAAPGDSDGAGLKTFLAGPIDCNQPDRSGTKVAISSRSGRASAATCVAIADSEGGIAVTLTFNLPKSEVVTVQLGQCPGSDKPSDNASMAPTVGHVCRFTTGAERSRSGITEVSYELADGTFSLLPDASSGRVVGQAMVTFSGGGDDLSVSGPLDLPLFTVDP